MHFAQLELEPRYRGGRSLRGRVGLLDELMQEVGCHVVLAAVTWCEDDTSPM
jgi:hypothetical protein